jgi:hypothetical protein
MQEHVLLNERGVLVSTARLATPQATYAVGQITSVRAATHDPGHSGPIGTVFLGLVVSMCGGMSFIGAPTVLGTMAALFGVVVVLAGIGWYRTVKPVYHVLVVTSAGEVPALSDRDWAFVSRVLAALNSAIIGRG